MSKQLERVAVALQSGNAAEAEVVCRRILLRKPRDISTLYHLGVALHRQSRTVEAKRIFTKVVKNAPDFAEAHFSLGIILYELNIFDRAENSLRMALELNPEMHIAVSRLGQLLVSQKKYSEALPLLKKVTQTRKDDAEAFASLVIAFRHLDLLENAITVCYQLLQLDDSEQNNSTMADLVYLLFLRDQQSACLHAQKWLELFPDSAFAQHISSAILGIEPHERASDSYVKELFDKFADTFEDQLASLGYQMPEFIADIASLDDSDGHQVILDAGCGTGLAAKRLREKASRLVGVDISPKMLIKAAEKDIYDELVEMELGAFLRLEKSIYNVIVASDVFIYFGDLTSIIKDAANALSSNGKLIFSVEAGDKGGTYALGVHGRYCHALEYVLNCIEKVGLQTQKTQKTCLRKEFGKDVNAFLIFATKPK